MKLKIIFIFMVMLAGITIPKNTHAQSFGLEDNGDGSYTLFMNGATIRTDMTGNYTSGSTGKITICDGCFAKPVTEYQASLPVAPDGSGQYMSRYPLPGYTDGIISGSGAYYTNYTTNQIDYVAFASKAQVDTITYRQVLIGYTQGCPSCEARAAQQTNIDQMNSWDYLNTIRTQSATQYNAIQAYEQQQMLIAWQQQNAGTYYYTYYNNYYTQQIRFGYSGSVSSLSPPPPPMMPTSPPRKDTLQPSVVTDTAASNRGATLTALLGSVEPTASMKDLRAGVNTRLFEVGFAINKVPGSTNPPVYVDSFYNKTGTSRNVEIPYDNWSAAFVHSHTPKDSAGKITVDGPSPQDMMGTIKAWADTSLYMKHRLIANYAISGDSLHHSEHAVAITDTAAAKAFWANPHNAKDSIIDNGTNGHLNNWAGREKDKNSLFKQFKDAYNKFKKAGYPIEYCEDYANVYMMWKLNMGIKFYRKVNGVFKELNYDPITDKITISQ
jgi:hypothetical protein